MTTATKPRIALWQPSSIRKGEGWLHLESGKRVVKEFNYHVREFATDYGRGFEVERFLSDAGSNGEIYHVLIADPGEHDHCSCLGFERWGHCKHLDSIKALIEEGKL